MADGHDFGGGYDSSHCLSTRRAPDGGRLASRRACRLKRIPASARNVQPWKNGLGVTEVIAAEHDEAGEELWRISVATISQNGPFSSYPGVSRLLMPLDVDGLNLSIDGVERRVSQYEVVAFEGEASVEVVGVRSAIRDLNAMARRVDHSITLQDVRFVDAKWIQAEANQQVVLVNLLRPVTCSGVELEYGDAVSLQGGEGVEMRGLGRLGVLTVSKR
ncbi:hypothetical protein DCE94_11720 [Agromyces badenianii]|nr:hypothetical protein DCE94_11720 [Agromyces badenianii]